MQTFFFDFREASGAVTVDEVGTQLPDAQAACREAERALAGIIADDPKVGADVKIAVRNEFNQAIYCVGLKCSRASFAQMEETFLGC